MTKRVYFFGDGVADGESAMKNLLGGKGANLAEMSRLGIPVPAGFTITTDVCTEFYEAGEKFPAALEAEVFENLRKVEAVMGAKFGDPGNPLLVSVRSGARASMPGMMDTILNLGLNDTTAKGLIASTGNERFVYDAYRRFVAMFSDVVFGIGKEGSHNNFELILEAKKHARGVKQDIDLSAADLKEVVAEFKAFFVSRMGRAFPDDPREQLFAAVGAVFKSWGNDRAKAYRAMYNIPNEWGTACNVQAMVFGNLGDDCATGVAFTRDPASGEHRFYGEFLINAQGEDVVAGIRTPQPVSKRPGEEGPLSMAEAMPAAFGDLERIYKKLEAHYKDMQDIEFTVQRNKLWMLQTRNGKRTGFAALRIAIDMVDEGVIDQKTAVLRIDPEAVTQLLRPIFNPDDKAKAIKDGRRLAKALPAGPGAAAGKIVLTAAKAEEQVKKGEKVVLVRHETSPEDIRGMTVSEGILTARGGMTSHAAVVGRQMGKVCVVGCHELDVDYANKKITIGGKSFNEGEWLSLDGFTGEILAGEMPTSPSEVLQVLFEGRDPAGAENYQRYAKLMSWADGLRRLKVRANADQGDQAANAIKLGAQGIGLCRTEHMFFGGVKIDAMREMILAEDKAGREKALAKLLPLQRDDFAAIFREMKELPVTIRTLDPPLHEFVPHTDAEIQDLAQKTGIPAETLKAKVESLHEFNPMLGHRGCRLGVTYPEITAMQARAIIEAALDVAKEGVDVHPEIMIPLVGFKSELVDQEKVVRAEIAKVFAERGATVNYTVGTMIELPRAALTADKIAESAEFFSFGTNDLTQTCMGLSRDDSGPFLKQYIDKGVIEQDPFQTLDQEGVGQLVEIAVLKGRKTRPGMKIGICGEHGGEPNSVEFCHRTGLDYVSCSPFRIPVARLAAAQAAAREM
jgi:pyruvate,orthophosphate dikinase